MNNMTKTLKQAAARKKMPLRQYVKEAANDGDHPYHEHALQWLKNKARSEEREAVKKKKAKDRAYRRAHPRKPGGNKSKKKDGKKG